jgi:uncharacterized membrane protein HdeD (DUF308 family)
MNELLLRSWWMLALREAIALLLGVLALVWPGGGALVRDIWLGRGTRMG